MRVIGLLSLGPGAGVHTLAFGLMAKGRSQGRSIEVFAPLPTAYPVVAAGRDRIQVAAHLDELAKNLPGLQRANVEVLVLPDLRGWLAPWSLDAAWAPVGVGKTAHRAGPTGLLW